MATKSVPMEPTSDNELAVLTISPEKVCFCHHGVKCKATEQSAPHGSVGETLIASASEMSADLLVMGCYGHARVREFVFGGASQHVLAHIAHPRPDVALAGALKATAPAAHPKTDLDEARTPLSNSTRRTLRSS